MRLKHFLLILVISSLCQIHATAQRYVVQVAAFSEPVDVNFYFGEKGVKGVKESVDHNLIYRYNIGPYPDLKFANRVAKKTQQAGFPNARVVDMVELTEKCANSCAPIDGAEYIGGEPAVTGGDNLFIRNIFFDFDRSHLKSESEERLDKLYRILSQNPTYKAELHGHTDWIGSDVYNNALAMRRSNKAKNYVVAKGISGDRIISKAFGEHNPVARNQLASGSDSEKGRGLNRRVEIRIVDANGEILWNVVESIDVPLDLKLD